MVLLEPVTAMQNSMFRLARHVFTMWSLLLAMIAIFTIVSYFSQGWSFAEYPRSCFIALRGYASRIALALFIATTGPPDYFIRLHFSTHTPGNSCMFRVLIFI
ncbi:hypothetical protein PRIPAC_80880 [Pristionchus pacificus]|uniref:Uncharacterized protein n=1 Tax=Pristionchus pacificus TaxID=54126 RepID=A0A2A6CJ88_PRIPA|nr:hypothetical protein PRIPAC_80880 [Pristionchus pacificus]|eukprot:PDM78186.1 hypothetical protein PRIPAC_30765 [Pristionchus pacificus]